jgi:cytochrome oxidase Cu insertion factor (SCO1/SenC/PrrC family)
MKNITVCVRRMWMAGWTQSLVVAAFLLVVGGDPPLAAAATLGPTDGNGLAPTDLERVKVGDPAPDFTLEDENGKPMTLSQFREKQDVILVFYRGHW